VEEKIGAREGGWRERQTANSFRSPKFESYLEQCFQGNPYFRATASQLLTHPFFKMAEDGWTPELRRKLELVFIGSSLRRSGLL
jgi:hypothetical protein